MTGYVKGDIQQDGNLIAQIPASNLLTFSDPVKNYMSPLLHSTTNSLIEYNLSSQHLQGRKLLQQAYVLSRSFMPIGF